MKKAKKGFSSGLSDLFTEGSGVQSTLFGAAETPFPAVGKTAAAHKALHKNFLSDIDAFLQEALEESLEKYETLRSEGTTGSTRSPQAAPAHKIPSGLDALIRQTVDIQERDAEDAAGKKRLTVAVDRTKLDQLRLIARLENSYLKDLLSQVIDSYIEHYKQHKGISL